MNDNFEPVLTKKEILSVIAMLIVVVTAWMALTAVVVYKVLQST